MPKAKTPKMTVADEATCRDVDRLQEILAANKAAYREIDEIEERIHAAFKSAKSKRLTLPDGRVMTIKDNYRDRNKAFKTCAFPRYEIVVV